MTHKLTVRVTRRMDRGEVIQLLISEASYYGPDYVLSICGRRQLVGAIRSCVDEYGRCHGRHDELDEAYGFAKAKAIRQKITDLVDRLLPELRD